MIASRLAGSTWVFAEWPQILSGVVIVSPPGPRGSISKTRTPACRRMERHFGPAGYRFASIAAAPVLSVFTLLQSHGSNRTPGNGSMWSFSASNSSITGTSCRQWSDPATRPHSSSHTRVSVWKLSADGIGTIRLRLTKPTAFSTLPFPWPEYGSRNRGPNP